MIASFRDAGTEDVYNGVRSKAATKCCPEKLWKVARSELDQLDAVTSVDELQIPPGNRLELLIGDRKDQYSIRINDQYRICFLWTEAGPLQVEIVDYH